MGLHKILKYVGLVLGLIGVILLAMIWLKGDDEVIANFQNGIEWYMYVAYFILVIVVVLVLIYVLKGVFAGNVKKTLVAIGAIFAVFLIAYLLSTGVETQMKDNEVLSAGGSKLVGTGLRMFYILTLIAFGAMAWTGVKKLTNK